MWVLRWAEEYDFERFKKEELSMPRVKANNITMNYDQQGSGEPLILIPYLAADHACYAFQEAEYAKHFTCISLDLRGTGETETTEGAYSTELLADDVVAFMRAMGIAKAHVSGLSLGAATGMWVAAKYPGQSNLAFTAQRLAQDGRLHKSCDRLMAGAGRGDRECHRDDHLRTFPMVLHA